MTIFAGIFFIVGLIPGFMALKHIYNYVDASDWVAVPATITAVDLSVSRSDGNDTYLTTAEYNYQYQGQSFTGSRVGFGSGSDNIGSFHQDAYAELNNYKNRPGGFNAWVDPDKPGNSVLYRDIRWPLVGFLMLFLLIFSGAGAGIYLLGKFAIRRANKQAELQDLYPDEPWKWRADWQNNTIKASNGPLRWFATVFAIFWNLVSLPLWFVIPAEVAKGNYEALIAVLFPIVGIGVIIWAIRSWRQYKIFGNSQLELRQTPIPLGGMLNAKLILPEEVPGGTELKLTLNCIRKTQSSGSKKKTSENILWQTEQTIRIPDVTGRYTAIPIRIQIPVDQPPAVADTSQTGIIWRLLVDTDIPGVDYETSFELPVFDTGLDLQLHQDQSQNKLTSETGSAGIPANSGVIIEGSRYWFPPGRNNLAVVAILFFGAIFTGAGIFLIISVSKIFGGVFAAVGALILWGAAALAFKRSEILLENGQLIASSGWFGLREKLRLPSFQIKKLWIKSNMSINNVKYYDLYLSDQQGNKYVLASNLKGRRDTEALIRLLEDALGISNS